LSATRDAAARSLRAASPRTHGTGANARGGVGENALQVPSSIFVAIPSLSPTSARSLRDCCAGRLLYAAAVSLEGVRQILTEVGIGRRPVKDRAAIAAAKAARAETDKERARSSRGGYPFRGGYSGRGRGGGSYSMPPAPPTPKAVAKEAWSCGTCTFNNAVGTSKCDVCAAEYSPSTAKPAVKLPSAVTVVTYKKEPWSCEVCTFVNDASETAVACSVCMSNRPAPKPASPAPAPAPAASAPAPTSAAATSTAPTATVS